MFVTVGGMRLEKTVYLNSVGERTLSGVARKTESGGGVRLNQFIYDN